jgi:hypothetical protein
LVAIAASDGSVPRVTVPLFAIVGFVEGLFFGVIIALSLSGGVVSLIALTRPIGSIFQHAVFRAGVGGGRVAKPSGLSADTRIAPSILPNGQEPLPEWIPERVQVGLWVFWIRSYAWHRRVSNTRTV